MPYLKSVTIQFDTHDEGKDNDTVLHVFVRNRLNTSRSPEGNTDFISNLLDSKRYELGGDLTAAANDPYLAIGVNLAPNVAFDNPSSHTIPIPLRSTTISVDDIVLPSVSIHILANNSDTWIFDYTVVLTFDDGGVLSFTSKVDGVVGIILDQDNRNHSGIGTENLLRKVPIPTLVKPVTSSLLTRITLEFATQGGSKSASTKLNAHIVNRLSASSSSDLAIGLDLRSGEEFPSAGPVPPAGETVSLSYKKYVWGPDGDGVLASSGIRLADMVLPVVNIIIDATADDRWTFDYQVTFEFTDPNDFELKTLKFSSRTNGVILSQGNNKHTGAYQGTPFPTVSPPTAPPLTSAPAVPSPKKIPLAFLRKKFDEFINTRNDKTNTEHNPPLTRIRLDNTGVWNGSTEPESYVDQASITAERGQVGYISSPTSLGQNDQSNLSYAGNYFQNINSASLNIALNAAGAETPFSFTLTFDPSGSQEVQGFGHLSGAGMNITEFLITVNLTLDLASGVNSSGMQWAVADVMSWVTEIQKLELSAVVVPPPPKTPPLPPGAPSVVWYHYTGTFLKKHVDITSTASANQLFVDQVIQVTLETQSVLDRDSPLNPREAAREAVRDQIYAKLTTPDIITQRTPRDDLNSQVTSWLCGGVADDAANTDDNNIVISAIEVAPASDPDNILVTYTGPRVGLELSPPAGWPAGVDFSPGTLASIEHIVVLTMENRSFDHMLGYLSLPTAQGGMGRTDVDGLKGDESNPYVGKPCPSFAITDTYFPTDAPHSHEPVMQAIDGGKMDGFALSYADDYGSSLAGRIMGHQTGAGVPTYDALARDFAIGHRWFASHPGPTFCNRFYELTGRLNLDPRGFWELSNSNPLLPVYTPTIFDYLDTATDPQTGKLQPVSWAYFEHGYCFLRFFERHTFDGTNIATCDDPDVGFFTRAREGTLPSVSFIDPHFIEYPPDATCDGPPSDVTSGQAFVSQVVEALVAGRAWSKTLLVITYDEHGGFYDHVPPPTAPKVSPELPVETLGVRVPAIVVSPWVAAGTVFGHDAGGAKPGSLVVGGGVVAQNPQAGAPAAAKQVESAPALKGVAAIGGSSLHFDHTSILKTIVRCFLSHKPPYMGARYAAASDLSAVLGTVLRAPQFRPFIRYNLQFAASKLSLAVKDGNTAAGTLMEQASVVGPAGQDIRSVDFSFEDAGDGYFYIRSHVSNLYVTTQGDPGAPTRTPTSGEVTTTPTATAGSKPTLTGLTGLTATAIVVGSGTAAAPAATGFSVFQDVKYTASGLGTIAAQSALDQKWKLTPVTGSLLEPKRFLITSLAHPGKELQPVDPTQPSALVLGDPGPTVGPHAAQNAWTLTSPVLNSTPPVLQVQTKPT